VSTFRTPNAVRHILKAALPALTITSTAIAAPLIIDTSQTAGISGFANAWDKAFPNARTADAVHRSVLLRFPGSAEQIAERLAQDGRIAKADIVFEYEGFEPQPAGYDVRGHVPNALKKNPPRWHYVAWPLRRPWAISEDVPAPTFNAYLDGAGYWTKYGAQDEAADRYPRDPTAAVVPACFKNVRRVV